MTSGFLGPRAMRTLGLPTYVPPWYPVLRIPVNTARSIAALALPGDWTARLPAAIASKKRCCAP
ncbi:hypothetical protein I553_6306 [Mycobacterium xenopi 4042]|uniref:Uncharacterized protein n=1 Tax=Mycobacterium xenopi 4042 TaxID=1299334 RepID=X8BG48_MYCXE|nr:hypothetical protein I553_6306 [Mycobacterium xenopi 4042]